MPTPSQSCPDCGKAMTYDPLLSLKNQRIAHKNHNAFWCTRCSLIVIDRRFNVNFAVTTVNRYIIHGKLP